MIYIIFFPFLCYWGTCFILNKLNIDENYNKFNIANKNLVFNNVLIGTASHIMINFLLYKIIFFDLNEFRYMYIIYGIILVDTIEYFMHRALHKYKFLYKFHKVHHELINPYNFGALYNSIVEGIIEISLILICFLTKNVKMR